MRYEFLSKFIKYLFNIIIFLYSDRLKGILFIILKLYGISQDPNTKDYIIVLQYANSGNIYIHIKLYWSERLEVLRDIIKGLKKFMKIKWFIVIFRSKEH